MPRPRQTLDQPFSLRLTPADVADVQRVQAMLAGRFPALVDVFTHRQVMRLAMRLGLKLMDANPEVALSDPLEQA